ncbi:MAG: glycosyltransferase family 4 protein [Solirubrobacteraceae bacterium]
MRPTLLAPAYWPEVRRGTERAIRLLADGLVAEGHRPRLVCGHPGPRPTRTSEDGLDVVRLPRPIRRRLWRHRYDDHAAHLPLAVPLLVADPGDVLHAFYPTDAVAAVTALRVRRRVAFVLGGVPRGPRGGGASSGRPAGRSSAAGQATPPLVISVMGPPDRPWALAHRGRLEGIVDAARDAAVVTTLSRFAADRLWRTFAVRSEIVPPPVDLDAFAPGSDPGRHAEPTLLFASDPDAPAKRLGLLLDAFARVRARRPGVRLIVQQPRTDADRRALDALPGVRTADLDDREVLRDAYRRAWATVLPSENEAFGLVVAESLACGTPAVAFAGEGPAEVITGPDVGRIASTADAGALARAIAGALELAVDAATRERCRAAVGHLGVAEHARRTLDLYAAALRR